MESNHGRIIERRFVVAPDFHGMRLDHYLKQQIQRLSRTRIQTLIRHALTSSDGRCFKPHSPVQVGDELILRREARPEPPCPLAFDVLWHDDDCMVIDKPPGLPVHATARYYFHTLTRLLSARFPDETLQIAHRLDRETSGCLVVARHRGAARQLKQAFAQRRVRKTYLALVHGVWEGDGATWIETPLKLVAPTARVKIRVVPAVLGDPGAWACSTHVSVVARYARHTLLACVPITGRQHQIRVHLATVGYPIVGDKLYGHGDDAFIRFCEQQREGRLSDEAVAHEFGLARQALHAARIEFPHPHTGAPVCVESPLPQDIRACAEGA